MELRNHPKTLTLSYNYQTETTFFLAKKHEKTIMACSYLNFYKYLFPSF